MPPAELWDYYRRLNRKATIEVIAVPVAEFADRVPDPDEAELKSFFDKYNSQLAIPGSPEPGFRLPRRQKFQYFKAEHDLFREVAQVTEEEIKKYYEENKQSFRKLSLPEEEKKEDKPVVENPDPESETPENSKDGSAKPVESDPPTAESKEEAPSDLPNQEKPEMPHRHRMPGEPLIPPREKWSENSVGCRREVCDRRHRFYRAESSDY